MLMITTVFAPSYMCTVAWIRSSAEVAEDGIVVDVYSKVLSDISSKKSMIVHELVVGVFSFIQSHFTWVCVSQKHSQAAFC
jgi:hypothetical protein